MSVPDGTKYDYGMSGNAHQRRKARRAKERLAKALTEKIRRMDSESLIVKSEPPDERTAPTFNELTETKAELPPTTIVQPEPSGEAIEILLTEGAKKKIRRITEAMESNDIVRIPEPKKKRGIWNWLRKLLR